MPGSDDQYDQVHTYSQDHAGKSKTTKPAVREIGRDGAPVELFVGSQIDETAIRTPPAGVAFLFFNSSGTPRKKDSTGTVSSIGKSTEAVQDDVGTIMNEPLDYDDATPAIDVSLSTQLQVDGNGDLDVNEGNVDAGDLGGSSGSNNNLLETNGTAAAWTADLSVTSITTETATINDLSAVMEKSTDQSISQNTDATIDWDNQDVDTDLYTYSTSNDDLTVLEAGDYHVSGQIVMTSLSAGDRVFIKIHVNGTRIREAAMNWQGTDDQLRYGVTLKDLAANDTIRLDAGTDSSSGGVIQGNTFDTYWSTTRSG